MKTRSAVNALNGNEMSKKEQTFYFWTKINIYLMHKQMYVKRVNDRLKGTLKWYNLSMF